MKKYRITVKEIHMAHIVVDAPDEQAALEQAMDYAAAGEDGEGNPLEFESLEVFPAEEWSIKELTN